MKNYLIVANGNFLVEEIICEAALDKIIVGVDGAALKLLRLGIKPHVILGDFDSLQSPYQQPQSDITTIHLPDQNHPDLVKAIRYCDGEGASSITIICALGGRLDHQESVLRALRTEYKKDRPITLHSDQQSICFAKDETIVIEGEIGDVCAVMAYPKGIFSSLGLAYEVNQYELDFGFSESICNALTQEKAIITVQGEALIIKSAQLISQRNFSKKSEVERLELQLRDARKLIQIAGLRG